jgi:hypothetical protein
MWISYGKCSSRQRPHDAVSLSRVPSVAKEQPDPRRPLRPIPVRKWRKRTTTADTPMAPKALKSTVLSLAWLYPSRFDESVVEHDGELGLSLAPFAWRHSMSAQPGARRDIAI